MNMRKISYFLPVLSVLATGCGMQTVSDSQKCDALPDIYPDYTQVTIPTNIAPLNFSLNDSLVERIDVVIKGQKGGELHTQGSESTDISVSDWKALLLQNAGDSLSVTVSAKRIDGWTTYRTFGIYVSKDAMDETLVYRKLAPGYEKYSKMGIYERDLTSYQERALLENTSFQGCVNCHEFSQNNPAAMSLHIRGPQGATLLMQNGQLEALETRTNQTLGSCVYPYWHPSGKYIAYSTNKTEQTFHVMHENRIEVYDQASDVQVYDVENNLLLTPEILKNDSLLETYPVFSADGKSLYFCSATTQNIPQGLNDVRYNLCRIDFDPTNGTFGERIDTIVNAVAMDKSVTFPKPSYDGKFLVYTLADYGTFSIWHHEADLYMLDMATGNSRAMEKANSQDTDSYHNWSSNNRWMVFSSRRDDGLFTRPYFCHIDEQGRESKPFMLPQQNPKAYYGQSFLSYNVPAFATEPVPFDTKQAMQLINSGKRVQMGVK